MTSFAHGDLSMAIQTLRNRHVTGFLREDKIKCIQIQEGPDCDPLLLEYRIQEEFVERVEKFDWFLFIEDDIVL